MNIRYFLWATILFVGSSQAGNTYLVNLTGTPLTINFKTSDNRQHQEKTTEQYVIPLNVNVDDIISVDANARRLKFDSNSGVYSLSQLQSLHRNEPNHVIAFIAGKQPNTSTLKLFPLSSTLELDRDGLPLLQLAVERLTEYIESELESIIKFYDTHSIEQSVKQIAVDLKTDELNSLRKLDSRSGYRTR